MRLLILLSTTAMLAACGGGGQQTINSTPLPGGGGGSSGGGLTNTVHSFANPTEPKTYVGIGANQVLEYSVDKEGLDPRQQQVLYSANATTVRDSNVSIEYNPRDAIFTVSVADPLTGANAQVRFQDPASRTDFDGAREPQWGTPELANQNIGYLQAGDGDPRSPYRVSGTGAVAPGTNEIAPDGTPTSTYQSTSFFYLKPGTETQYVTYAGYARNQLSFRNVTVIGGNPLDSLHLERGAFAYGEVSASADVPTKGTGNYSGSMLASMLFNPTLDQQIPGVIDELPSYFQWIEGTANLAIDFAASTFNVSLSGDVFDPQIYTINRPADPSLVKGGATFAALGRGDINLANFGGFKGLFDSAGFTNPDGSKYDVAIGGSSIDGAFYGPNGEEVGGGFRIVGGNPDERVDILGAFVGTK